MKQRKAENLTREVLVFVGSAAVLKLKHNGLITTTLNSRNSETANTALQVAIGRPALVRNRARSRAGDKQINYGVEFYWKKPKKSEAFSFPQRSSDSNLQLQFPPSRFSGALLSGSDELPVGAEIRTA